MNRLATVSALLLALCMHGGEAAAQDLPPPGWYRVDANIEQQHKTGPAAQPSLSAQTDGASGDETYRTAGGDTKVFKGSGPMNQCLKAGTAPLPPAFARGMCKTESTTRTAAGMVQKASCQTGKMTLTIRRLDAKTWEYVSEMDMSSGSAPNLDGTRAMLEMVAKTAAAKSDRDKAAQALAQMPRMETDMNRGRAQAQAAMQEALAKAKTPEEVALARSGAAAVRGRIPMQIRDRTTLTRISDTCPSR